LSIYRFFVRLSLIISKELPKAAYQSSAKKRLTQHGGETFDAPSEWMR